MFNQISLSNHFSPKMKCYKDKKQQQTPRQDLENTDFELYL